MINVFLHFALLLIVIIHFLYVLILVSSLDIFIIKLIKFYKEKF